MKVEKRQTELTEIFACISARGTYLFHLFNLLIRIAEDLFKVRPQLANSRSAFVGAHGRAPFFASPSLLWAHSVRPYTSLQDRARQERET